MTKGARGSHACNHTNVTNSFSHDQATDSTKHVWRKRSGTWRCPGDVVTGCDGLTMLARCPDRKWLQVIKRPIHLLRTWMQGLWKLPYKVYQRILFLVLCNTKVWNQNKRRKRIKVRERLRWYWKYRQAKMRCHVKEWGRMKNLVERNRKKKRKLKDRKSWGKNETNDREKTEEKNVKVEVKTFECEQIYETFFHGHFQVRLI